MNSQKFAIWTFRKSLTYASDLATATQVQNKSRQHYPIINAESLTRVMQQYLHKVLKQRDMASFAHSCKGQVHMELSLNKHQKNVEPSNPVTIHHTAVTFQTLPYPKLCPLKYKNIQQILGEGPSEIIVSSLNQIADKFRCSGKGSTSNSMLDHLVLAEVTVTK